MRRRLQVGVVLFLFLLLTVVYASSAQGAGPNFAAVASAEAIYLQTLYPGGPAVDAPIDGGLYASQAVLSSNNESFAFASSPYPSEFAVFLPRTLAGLLAGNGIDASALPDYPLYARSTYPATPHAEAPTPPEGLPVQAEDSPLRLVADSSETTSAATATSGVTGEQNVALAMSTSSVKADGARVVAESIAKVQGLSAEGVRVASLISKATATLTSDGKVERSSQLDVEGLFVNDLALKVTRDGIGLADQTVPLDSAAVEDALKNAGVTLEVLEPVPFNNGIMSGGLLVSYTVEDPQGGKVTLTSTLGRSLARISSAANPDELPVVPPVVAPPSGDLGGGAPPAAPPVDVAPDQPQAPAPDLNQPSVQAIRRGPTSLTGDDIADFYLIVIAGAAGVVLFSQALRLKGVTRS